MSQDDLEGMTREQQNAEMRLRMLEGIVRDLQHRIAVLERSGIKRALTLFVERRNGR